MQTEQQFNQRKNILSYYLSIFSETIAWGTVAYLTMVFFARMFMHMADAAQWAGHIGHGYNVEQIDAHIQKTEHLIITDPNPASIGLFVALAVFIRLLRNER